MKNVLPMTPRGWVKFLQHIDQMRAIKVTRLTRASKEIRDQLKRKSEENKKIDEKMEKELDSLIKWYERHLRLLERCKKRISASLIAWERRQEGGSHV